MDPNGNLLGEERGYNFAFEDGVIGASAQREFEYTGEELVVKRRKRK